MSASSLRLLKNTELGRSSVSAMTRSGLFLPLPASAGRVGVPRFVGSAPVPRSGGHRARWRCDGELGQAPQVLHGGGQQELVPGAAQAAEAELRQRQIALDVAEQGLDLLALTRGVAITIGLHEGAGIIAGLCRNRVCWRDRGSVLPS